MRKMITLDSDGYISDPSHIIDRTMNNFFTSNYSQTVVHVGQIKSLPYLVRQFASDNYGLERACIKALTDMLSAHFESVIVEANIEPIDPEKPDSDRVSLTISAVVYTANGKSYDMAKLLSLVNNKITNITEV